MTTEQNSSSGILRFAGDVSIEDATITSMVSGLSFNVTNQLITIEIFEDMFAPFITGSLIFRESLDFANAFPFVGQEYLDLKVSTPTFENSGGTVEGRFYIYKLSDRQEVSERSTVYKLAFISGEAIVDLNNKISRAYSGKISDIVENLISDESALSSEKPYNIEETKNKTKYVSNYWSPIKNITYLLEHAQTIGGEATYTFFENRGGFNFVSLDLLNSLTVKQTFKYNDSTDTINPSGGSSRNIERDFKKITEMKIPVTFDFLKTATNGVYASTLKYNDLTTKRYFDVKYSFLRDWGDVNKEVRLNKFPLAANNVFTTYNSTIFHDVVATPVSYTHLTLPTID
jgi:hypothetical protein